MAINKTDQYDVSQVDFNASKELIKTFIKNTGKFNDYNFEGSALSVLIDTLAYTHHMSAASGNLVFGETFLDSALQRSSVTSRAKEIGYLPRSKAASKATLQVSFSVTGNPVEYVIPRGTIFSTNSTGESFNFVTTQDYTIRKNSSNTYTGDIEVYQGKFLTFSYVVNETDLNQKFIIPSIDTDNRFLTVSFKQSQSQATYLPMVLGNASNLDQYGPNSLLYFLSEGIDGFYELYFGDDHIAYKVKTGNIIELKYFITAGESANGASAFSLTSPLASVTGMSIQTLENSSYGSDRETIESIKFLAPMSYSAQNRAVIESDYVVLMKSDFSEIDDVSVWGGEKNIPPVYGRVFAAIKPKYQETLSETAKSVISSKIASKYSITGFRPFIVDPDYTFVIPSVVVTYDPILYSTSSNIDLETIVRNTIDSFFSEQVNKFGRPLYYSKLSSAIDSCSPVIKSSVTNIKLEKRLEIYAGTSGTYKYEFNNTIDKNSIISNQIVVGGNTCYIVDAPDDTISLTSASLNLLRASDNSILIRNVGNVDYNNGIVTITNLNIQSIVDDTIYRRLSIFASPGKFLDPSNTSLVFIDNNVYANDRDQIIALKPNSTSITIISDRE